MDGKVPDRKRKCPHLDGNLAELEDVTADTVQLLYLVKHREEIGAVLQPCVVLSLHFFP